MLLLESDIPDYLKSSPYFLELVKDEHFPATGIEVPQRCAKKDMSVKTETDLIELLDTLRFWLIPEKAESATELIEFVLQHGDLPSICEINLEYGRDIPFLRHLCYVFTVPLKDGITLAAGLRAKTMITYLAGLLRNAVRLPCSGYKCYTCNSGGEIAVADITIQRLSLTLDTLLTQTSQLHSQAFVVCAGKGYLDGMKELLQSSALCNESTAVGDALFIAAKNGHVECLQYLWITCTQQDDDATRDLLCGAAAGGKVEVLMFVIDVGISISAIQRWALDRFIQKDCLDCLLLLHRVGLQLTEEYLQRAIVCNSKKYFHYLLDQDGLFRSVDVCLLAAGEDNAEFLEYAHQRGWPIKLHTGRCAVRAFSLDCLKYLHSQGCPWNEVTCSHAAGMGAFECLQYLHENGCPWDENTCSAAASGRSRDKIQLKCLQYAHEHGCPWSEDTSESTGSWMCLKYLIMHQCPGVEHNPNYALCLQRWDEIIIE